MTQAIKVEMEGEGKKKFGIISNTKLRFKICRINKRVLLKYRTIYIISKLLLILLYNFKKKNPFI